jgi:hypothetical protein
MARAFWNNPIVVSSFRTMHRQGTLSRGPFYYLLFVAIGVSVFHYFNDALGSPFNWARITFVGLMAVQFMVSSLFAVRAGISIRHEVTTHTLDAQRLTKLTPRSFLVGKLLGPSAMAFLLPIVTIPFSVICWLDGGVPFQIMVLLYINLATGVLLVGTIVLRLHTFSRASRSRRVILAPFWILVFELLLACYAMSPNVPWSSALVGLYLPVQAFHGLVQQDVLTLALFEIAVPFLLITPAWQLFVSFLCFERAVRQLIDPLSTPGSRMLSYVALIVIDLVAAAVLYDMGPWSLTLGSRSAAFCLVHLGATVYFMGNVTPDRQTLNTWVWRFRGRVPRWPDLWLGGRSENGLAMLTFAVIGLINLLLFVLCPGIATDGLSILKDEQVLVANAVAVLIVVSLATGSMHQLCAYLMGQGSLTLTVMVLAGLSGFPHLLTLFGFDQLEPISPSAHFLRWLSYDPQPMLALGPLLAVYTTILLLCRYVFLRKMRGLANVVIKKAAEMTTPTKHGQQEPKGAG